MLAFLALFFYHSEKGFQNKLKDSVPCVAEFFWLILSKVTVSDPSTLTYKLDKYLKEQVFSVGFTSKR